MPDIVDFARGLRALVSDTGYVSIEIPHLLRLVESREYDTIYHEHFSYLSLLTTQRVLARAGLTVVDVDELTTHGGSLRTWSTPARAPLHPPPTWPRFFLTRLLPAFTTWKGTMDSSSAVAAIRNDFVEFLVDCSRKGAIVAGYGAPGKGNTLLNHCGIRSDLLEYTVDLNPFKHGKFLPGRIYPSTRWNISPRPGLSTS